MYRCVVMLRNLEEAEALTVLINKYKQNPGHKVWNGNFWKSNFKSDTDWGVYIALDGPEKINEFSYCDIPWYETNPSYCNADFLYLEEFIEILKTGKPEPEPESEPFIRPITMEDIYNGKIN